MIQFWQALTALAGFLVLAGFISDLLGHLATRRHFAKTSRPALPNPVPKISILKPVEGAGSNTYEAFASFCRLDYPGEVEIIIGTIRPDDPIVAVAGRLRAEFPKLNIQLVFAELKGTNRKTSIMEAQWQKASGQYLFFSDADVVAPADYLRRLVPEFAQPETGCLTCLPRGMAAQTMGGKLIALHYGFNYLPQWMLAQKTTGIHWAIGHTMALPRAVMEKLGGFKNFLDHLADDYEFGNRISRLGLRVLVPPLLLDCVVPSESFARTLRRLLRWKRTIRRARGPQYFGVVLTYPVFWAFILALLQPLTWWSWSTLVVIVLVRCLLAAGLQTIVKMPDWPRAWYLLPVLDIVEGIVFFGTYLGDTVFWAGRRYTLLPDGTLKPAEPEARSEKGERVAPTKN
jgi:ceramide glucosyltransferase